MNTQRKQCSFQHWQVFELIKKLGCIEQRMCLESQGGYIQIIEDLTLPRDFTFDFSKKEIIRDLGGQVQGEAGQWGKQTKGHSQYVQQ